MSNVDIEAIILGAMGGRRPRHSEPRKVTPEEAARQAKDLPELMANYNKPMPTLRTGDLVQVRTDIACPYSKPAPGQPAIIVNDSIPAEANEPGTFYTRETMLMGVVSGGSDFVVFSVDPHYLEPYKPSEAAQGTEGGPDPVHAAADPA